MLLVTTLTSRKKRIKKINQIKSNIPVINLILDSSDIIKVSKNMSLQKIRLMAKVVFTKYRQFLNVF